MADVDTITLSATCPSCGELVRLRSRPKLGQRTTCEECEEVLEVVSIDPLEFEWADVWDDDDDDDDDDSYDDDDWD